MPHSTSSAFTKIKKMDTFRKEEMYIIYLFMESIELIKFDIQASDNTLWEADLKHFLQFLSFLINDQHFKLSYQMVEDLKNEFLRLHFNLHCSYFSGEIPAISAAKQFLKDKPRNDKITINDFRYHMQAFSDDGCDLLQYADVISDLDTFYPVIQRGHWWKCTKGHYYCSPLSQLSNIKLDCPRCKGTYVTD